MMRRELEKKGLKLSVTAGGKEEKLLDIKFCRVTWKSRFRKATTQEWEYEEVRRKSEGEKKVQCDMLHRVIRSSVS